MTALLLVVWWRPGTKSDCVRDTTSSFRKTTDAGICSSIWSVMGQNRLFQIPSQQSS